MEKRINTKTNRNTDMDSKVPGMYRLRDSLTQGTLKEAYVDL